LDKDGWPARQLTEVGSGGSEAGGSEAGGSEAGGSDAGGSDAGGSDFGGSDFGGGEAGGSDAGGISDAGGSEAGGSQVSKADRYCSPYQHCSVHKPGAKFKSSRNRFHIGSTAKGAAGDALCARILAELGDKKDMESLHVARASFKAADKV
jgi:hypothetical protein